MYANSLDTGNNGGVLNVALAVGSECGGQRLHERSAVNQVALRLLSHVSAHNTLSPRSAAYQPAPPNIRAYTLHSQITSNTQHRRPFTAHNAHQQLQRLAISNPQEAQLSPRDRATRCVSRNRAKRCKNVRQNAVERLCNRRMALRSSEVSGNGTNRRLRMLEPGDVLF